MILTIDIGNTNIAVGCFNGEKPVLIERISTKFTAATLEYIVLLRNIFELNGVSISEIEGGIISSVVPSVTTFVEEAVESVTGKKMLVLDSTMETGLEISIDDPSHLGGDFIAAAVAGVKLYSAPIIIIDMNTATSVSVVDSKRRFIGGLIIPGAQTALDALVSKTSQLPGVSLTPPKKVIGTNTVDSIKSGIIFGNASSVEGIIRRIENELGEKCTVVATGELARTILPNCRREILIEDDLLMKGLSIIYYKNKR